MPSDFVVILTTFPAEQDAEALAKALVDERLAACVNILPEMRSVYTWQGKTDSAAERQLVIKTARSRVDALEARLKQLHPYDVPEFVLIEIAGGSADYLSWLSDSTR
ncbi:MAG: divalent-cation tolerance protein CutA [Acidimicrobiia bacterium]